MSERNLHGVSRPKVEVANIRVIEVSDLRPKDTHQGDIFSLITPNGIYRFLYQKFEA